MERENKRKELAPRPIHGYCCLIIGVKIGIWTFLRLTKEAMQEMKQCFIKNCMEMVSSKYT